MAHGKHIWFVSPEQNAKVREKVTFQVTAPYAKNHYIHLSISSEENSTSVWESLIELHDKAYTAQIDTSNWKKGKYKAEVLLMGGLVQHPVYRYFTVE